MYDPADLFIMTDRENLQGEVQQRTAANFRHWRVHPQEQCLFLLCRSGESAEGGKIF